MRISHFDLIIVGGGLSGCLAALAVSAKNPQLKFVLVEQGHALGGNHLWSFFSSDVAPDESWLIAPLISYGWSGNEVRFPEYARSLKGSYYSIESERLDEVVRRQLKPDQLLTGRKVLACGPTSVVMENGQRLEAPTVIDARGPTNLGAFECGWQKFVGQELELLEPHGLTRPIIMDATVEQLDGYRFVYVLPFTPSTVFVEDTYYSDDSTLKQEKLSERISDYTMSKGWHVTRILRQESGVLPVIKSGNIDAYWAAGGARVPKIGARGGFMHGLTSYSLPDAVRTAVLVAGAAHSDAAMMNALLRDEADKHFRRQRFYHQLSSMLFDAAEPAERYKVMQRFYKMPESLISRFYSGQSSNADKARILVGKPPVPIGKALKALSGNGKHKLAPEEAIG